MRPLQVAVRPPGAFPGSSLLNNGLFAGVKYNHLGDSTHWLRPYGALKKRAAEQGYELVTEDLADLNSAAALLFMDIPADPAELRALRRAYPDLKLILQTIESATGRLWTLDPENHRQFDAIVSYDDRHAGLSRYFVHKIPAGGIDGWLGPLRNVPWEARRLVCMAAICKPTPPVLLRRTGLGMLRRGWRMSPATWWNYVSENNSLYGARQDVAVALAKSVGGDFDLFGAGWEEHGPAAVQTSFRGAMATSKLEFLAGYRFNIAFENCRNRCGYISEKIFDAFLAGTVPVYLGNDDILQYIPRETFVDVREFRSYADLVQYLQVMPQDQWQAMRDAADAFLRGRAVTHFGQDQYIAAVLGALHYCLGHSLPSARAAA